MLLRRAYIKLFAKKCGKNIVIQRDVHIRSSYNISFGDNVYINRGCHLDAYGGIEMQDGVGLGVRVTIITNDHSLYLKDRDFYKNGYRKRPVVLKKSAIVSSHSFINAGITIGENAIISAGTSVLVDIPDNKNISGMCIDLYSSNMKKSIKNLK